MATSSISILTQEHAARDTDSYVSFRIISVVIALGAGVLAGADVVVSANTDAAGAVVDVGTSFDLLVAAAFSGTRGRAAFTGATRAVTVEYLEAAPGQALVVVLAVGAVLQTGRLVSRSHLLHVVVVVGSREADQRHQAEREDNERPHCGTRGRVGVAQGGRTKVQVACRLRPVLFVPTRPWIATPY